MGSQLLLNPFGTFHRSEAAAYSGMREQVRLLLSLGREPPRLPRPLLRSGPEHLVLRAPGAPETERATPSRPPRRAR